MAEVVEGCHRVRMMIAQNLLVGGEARPKDLFGLDVFLLFFQGRRQVVERDQVSGCSGPLTRFWVAARSW